jgi:hypothetical protein
MISYEVVIDGTVERIFGSFESADELFQLIKDEIIEDGTYDICALVRVESKESVLDAYPSVLRLAGG